MNRVFRTAWKIFIAMLGGVNVIFSIAIPIFVASLIIGNTNLTSTNQFWLMLAGILSSLYRAIRIGITKR